MDPMPRGPADGPTERGIVGRETALALKRTTPFLLSVFPTGIVFGTFAVSQGLRPTEAILMSALVYSGVAQFSGLQLMAESANGIVVALVTLLVSLRLLVYGMALIDDIRAMPTRLRVLLSCLLVDQAFFMIKARIAEGGKTHGQHVYFATVALLIYVNWVCGTAFGALLGSQFAQESRVWGADFLAYAGFITLLAPYLRQQYAVVAAVLTAGAMILCHDLPYGAGILVASAVAVTTVMIGRRVVGARAPG